MKIDGHCHCGEISFEAELDPDKASLCHCTDCQRLTGSAFRATVPAPAASFVLRGEPRSYIKTAESGTKRHHAFCGNCGTPVFACAPEKPQSYSLRLGTITQRAALTPKRQAWRRSALAWVDAIAELPATERG